MTEKEAVPETENRIYELGFHIVSSIPEEKLSAEVTAIKDVLEKNGAVIFAEEFPKLKHLAYVMTKVINAKHLKFDTAYFGWLKFEITPSVIKTVKEALDLSNSILRYIVIKTVRENTLSVAKPPVFRATEPKPIPSVSTQKAGEIRSPVSEAELDKTIDALMVE